MEKITSLDLQASETLVKSKKGIIYLSADRRENPQTLREVLSFQSSSSQI